MRMCRCADRGRAPKLISSWFLFFLTFFAAAEAFAGVDMTIFGPKRYDRPKGAPSSYTAMFERCEPSDRAMIRVTNGSGIPTSITAGKVLVNGSAVFSENDFKNQLPLLEREITINKTNQLAVELKSGGPDTPFVIVEIIGRGCDSIPPSIYSPAPAGASILNTAVPLISAGYSDDAKGSGIDPASVRLVVDGTDRTASAAIGINGISLNPSPLPEGGHSVTLTVADRAANASAFTWNFTTDTVAPRATITAPRNGQYLNTPIITLSGSIDDPSAAVTVNSLPAQNSGGNWSIEGFSLQEGSNSLLLEARDPAGNKGTATASVILDTVKPVVSITAPVAGTMLNTPQITINGTVSEPVPTITVNGAPATVTGLAFSAVVNLAEGDNLITAAAVDYAGNIGSTTLSVGLDTVKPVVTVTNPGVGLFTNVKQVTVSGTVSEAVPALTANGAPVTINGSLFTATLPLAEGENTITLEAVDRAGNRGISLLVVTLDTAVPVITVTTPANGLLTNAPQVEISGSASEPLASLTINGAAVPLSSTSTFTSALPLAEGENSALIVATDLAGNSANSTIIVRRDAIPPKVAITSPGSGLLTSMAQVQITGTVDDATATLSANGAPLTLSDRSFSFGYTLSDGGNSIVVTVIDPAGNSGSATVAITLDAIAPVVTLTAPATATAGTDVPLAINATDNRGLTLVDLTADGATLWSAAPDGGATAVQTVSLRLSPALAVGNTVTVRGRGLDAAGNSGSATAVITIDKAADGPGWLQGKVLDDGRGLPLAGAAVRINDAGGGVQEITTTADGTWFAQLPPGTATIGIGKPGSSTVHRDLAVRPGQRTTVLDSRLTAVGGATRVIDATGGTVKIDVGMGSKPALTAELNVPAGALAAPADIRLTPISNQGLINTLPTGWSPLAAVDIRALDPQTGGVSAVLVTGSLRLPLPASVAVDPAAPPLLARYDETARAWLATGDQVSGTAYNSTLHSSLFTINGTGQYALLLADPAPGAPPQPQAGQPLSAVTPGSSPFSFLPDSITATSRVLPQASPPKAGLRAAGDLFLAAKAGAAAPPSLVSGLLVNAMVTEKFDLKSGDTLQPAATTQDIILYRYPCVTNIGGGTTGPFDPEPGLRTTFPVAPSREFTVVDLLLGKVSVAINPPGQSGGVMVGADGARLLQPDGTGLVIPQGALTGSVPVTIATLPEASAAPLVGSDFRLLRGVDLSIIGQTLKTGATLSIPAPAGIDTSLPIVVAKKFDIGGTSRLKLVAIGRLSGSIISSEQLPPELVNSSTTINSSGQYLFLQAAAPTGYVTGRVTGSDNAPFAGAITTARGATLACNTGIDGRYLLALSSGQQTVTALDQAKGDFVRSSVSVTANTKTLLDLRILMIPPAITAITPANASINVQPDVPVVVTFSKPMDKTSINNVAFAVRDAAGSAVSGTLTFNIGNTVATFYPNEQFKQEMQYTVTIAAAVKDLQGYPLGTPFTSSFTIRKTTPPAMPPAGSISATFPDPDGYITVTATQGSANPSDTVLLINDTTGEITSLKPQSSGSFSGRVRGQLGDEIKVVLMDYSGNQTTISYLTFRGPDNSYLVTAKGGKVEGEGGSILDIPEGALLGPAVIKVTAMAEASLPHPLTAPGRYLAAFNIDSGGIAFQKEIKLSMAPPPGFDPSTPVFVTKPSIVHNADGTSEQVYEIIDSTKIINGRITTSSWPFDGIMEFGSYVFTAFPELVVGIVSGYTYQDMNEQPGYQPTADASIELPVKNPDGSLTYKYDRPVRGAVIRSAQSWNYVSYSRSNGFYSAFTHYYGNIGIAGCRDYNMVAIHPLTMQKVTINGNACTPPYNVEKLNFKLAEKGTIPPDRDPPVIVITASKAPGQGSDAIYLNGIATAGTELQVTIKVSDASPVTATLSIELASDISANSRTTPQGLGNPVVSTVGSQLQIVYPPQFTENFAGRTASVLKPMEPGLFRLVVEAKDASGNLAVGTLDIKVRKLGEQAISRDGAPSVQNKQPPDGYAEVPIDTAVTAYFNEDVTNVTKDTFTLTDTVTNLQVPATVSYDVYQGMMKAVLMPKGNLAYGRKYRASLLAGITDTVSNPSANGAFLPLAPESWTFTTKSPLAGELNGSSFAARDIDYYFDSANGKLYAYVAAGSEGWRVVDVTDTGAMKVVWPPSDYRFPYNFDYRNLTIDRENGLLAMTDNVNLGSPDYHFGYVRFYDLTDPKLPVIVGREKLAESMSGIPGRVALANGYAYVCTVGVGIQVVDIAAARQRQKEGGASDGSTIVGGFDTNSPAYLGAPMFFVPYKPTAAALTTSSGKLVTLDLSIPAMPQSTNVYQPADPASTSTPPAVLRFGAMAAVGDFAYRDLFGSLRLKDLAVAGIASGGVRLIDLTNPASPQVIGVVKNLDNSPVLPLVRDISIDAVLGLAVATALDGVYVIDIRNPVDPRVLNRITELPSGALNPDGSPVMIKLDGSQALIEQGGKVYLANPVNGVKAIDLGAGDKFTCNPNIPCF